MLLLPVVLSASHVIRGLDHFKYTAHVVITLAIVSDIMKFIKYLKKDSISYRSVLILQDVPYLCNIFMSQACY